MFNEQPSILLVDDEIDILEVLGGQISLAGYQVEAYANPRDAIEAMRRTRFAAILSDYRMPGMCGLDVLARAREIQPCASRILVTGVLSIDTLMGSIESGLLHRFIGKPWARVELLAAIENAVQQRRLFAENQNLRTEICRLSDELNAANAKVEVMFDQLACRESGAEKRPQRIREVGRTEPRPGMKVVQEVRNLSGPLALDAGDDLTPPNIGRR